MAVNKLRLADGLNLKALYEGDPEVIGQNLYGTVIEERPAGASWLCCINPKWKTRDCGSGYIGNAASFAEELNKTSEKGEPQIIEYKYAVQQKNSNELKIYKENYSVEEVNMGKVFYVMKGVELGRIFGKYSKVFTEDIFELTKLEKSIRKETADNVSQCIANINSLKVNYYYGCDTFANELLINAILCDKLHILNFDKFILKIQYYTLCNKWGIIATDYHPLFDFGYLLTTGGKDKDAVFLFKSDISIDTDFLKNSTNFEINSNIRFNINSDINSIINATHEELVNSEDPVSIKINMSHFDNTIAEDVVFQLASFLYFAQKLLNFNHGDLTVDNVILLEEKEEFEEIFYIKELTNHKVTIKSKFRIKVTGFKYSSLTFTNHKKTSQIDHLPVMDFRNIPEDNSDGTAVKAINDWGKNNNLSDTENVKIRLFNLYKYNFLDGEYFKETSFTPKKAGPVCTKGNGLNGINHCSGTTWWRQGGDMWWKPGRNLMYVTQHTGLPYHRAYDFYTFMLSMALSKNGFATIFVSQNLTDIWKLMWLPQDYNTMTQLIFRLRNSKNPKLAKMESVSQYLSSVHLNCSIIVSAIEIFSNYYPNNGQAVYQSTKEQERYFGAKNNGGGFNGGANNQDKVYAPGTQRRPGNARASGVSFTRVNN
jgi:hypothetical protein